MRNYAAARGRATSSPALAEPLEARALFAVTPVDPLYPLQTWLPTISAPQAWDLTTGSSRVVVHINDSGVDYTHPDLYQNIWLNQKEIPFPVGKKGLSDTDADGLITFWDLNARASNGRLVNGAFVTDVNGTGYIDGGDLLGDPRWENGVDNGSNGFADDLVGWDFVNNDNDPMDDHLHGTFCAGIIGAVGNNNEGGAGLAWRVQMMATKNFDASGHGLGPEVDMAGVRYAADNGARISNNSWRHGNPNKHVLNVQRAGVEYAQSKGVLFVAAAGNESWDNDHFGSGQAFPATLDFPSIISVAASSLDDTLASFSNYGLTSVDLAAPGEDVGSTRPVYQDPAFPYIGGAGTSFATPHVAGTAALMLARNPGLSYAQLKDGILSSVDKVPALAGTSVTGGRLNVYGAVSSVSASPSVSSASAPSGSFTAAGGSLSRDLLSSRDSLLA